MDVRLPSGKIIKNVPAGTSKEAIKQKLISSGAATEADFGFTQPAPVQQQFSDVPGVDEVPGMAAPPAPAQQQEPNFLDKAIGVGEAALATGTGAIGGTLGMVGGALGGAYDEIASGQFGTPEAADRIEQAAMKKAAEYTYAPRTEMGQEYIQDIGELMGPMQALGPGIAARPPVTRARLPARKAQPNPAQSAADIIKEATGSGLRAKKARAALADLSSPDPEIVASAKRLGVEEYLQPDHVTTNQQFRDIAQTAKSIPGSELRALELDGLENVARRADNLITELGGTDDMSTMAYDVKNRLDFVQKAADGMVERYYGKIKESIPETATVKTDNIVGLLEHRAEVKGGMANLSPLERRLLKQLTPTEKYKPTYALLDDLRKEAGEGIKGKGVFKDTREGLRKLIYRELTEDQRIAAGEHGQAINWHLAKKATRLRKGVEDDMVTLFGRQVDKSFVTPLTSAYKRIPKGDIDALDNVLKAIPKDMRSRVAASGLAVALGKAGVKGDVSFNTYANWYQNAARNRTSFNRLLKHLPAGSERKLRDLYNIANGIRKAQREYKPTGRGELTLRAALQGADSMLAKIMVNSGKLGAAVSLESTIPGSGFIYAAREIVSNMAKKEPRTALDNLLSSTRFRRVLNERVRTGRSSDEAVRGLARSKVFLTWAKEYGVNIGTSPELWLLEAMRPNEDID